MIQENVEAIALLHCLAGPVNHTPERVREKDIPIER